MTRQLLKSLTLFVIGISQASASIGEEILDSIVATVNGVAITHSELDETSINMAMKMQSANVEPPPLSYLNKQVLEKIITEKAVLQYSDMLGIQVTSTDVTRYMRAIAKEQDLTLDEFESNVRATGLELDKYRAELKKELTIHSIQQQLALHDIVVPEHEVNAFLNSPIGMDKSGTEYKVRNILLETSDEPDHVELENLDKQAKDIVNKLKKGANFGKIAASHSKAGNALDGGNLGYRALSALPTSYSEHIVNMEPGEVVGPIRTSAGWHIIKLDDKRVGDKKVHTEVKVRHILIKTSPSTTSKDAMRILSKAKRDINANKITFAKFAEQKSEELRTATNGGDMGWVNQKNVLPEFFKVVKSLKKNQISEPFKTSQGWHIALVEDYRTSTSSDVAMKNHAYEILRNKKAQQAVMDWTKKVRMEAQVEILDKSLA